MRSKLMIVIIGTFLVGCNNNDGGGEDVESTTPTLKESSIISPPSEELKSQGYNDEYVQVPNTDIPDYGEYRKQWRRVNTETLHEGYALTDKPVELFLDDLTFKKAFHIEYCSKGEGQTFWWHGNEYTTDLRQPIIVVDDHKNPSVDKE